MTFFFPLSVKYHCIKFHLFIIIKKRYIQTLFFFFLSDFKFQNKKKISFQKQIYKPNGPKNSKVNNLKVFKILFLKQTIP